MEENKENVPQIPTEFTIEGNISYTLEFKEDGVKFNVKSQEPKDKFLGIYLALKHSIGLEDFSRNEGRKHFKTEERSRITMVRSQLEKILENYGQVVAREFAKEYIKTQAEKETHEASNAQ